MARHVAAHEGGEALCVAGSVTRHPQLDAGALTSWLLPEDRRNLSDGEAPHYADWRAYNLSLPRRVLLDSGGFDDGFSLGQFDDAELAWRLVKRGVPGVYLKNAYGYAWQPAGLAEERARLYARGYCLYRLLQITSDSALQRRYGVPRRWLRRNADAMVMPFYLQACQNAAQDIRVFGRAYRRLLRHALHCGFEDAARGRPPRESVPVA